jgi:hypothetical protein
LGKANVAANAAITGRLGAEVRIRNAPRGVCLDRHTVDEGMVVVKNFLRRGE